ncbi:cell adhesion molecule 2 isoform X3 [Alligator mississippiensis]|uniref:cell adhesion molecule 2 isoform X3 n=1 Tax=Alligator mississippiensis TaxID=8496 RepID=UPI0028779739|nr:cell adhesion molecule 2 isoform X3 [Alligator mississippiensis]
MLKFHKNVICMYPAFSSLFFCFLQKCKGSQGQFPLTQNVTVVEGGTANLTCRVDQNDNTSLQWSNPAQQTLYFDDKKALRDNRIELVRASWHELSISVSDVSLSDEGQYTCSLFTMPVKTSKAFLTVLGVPEKPQITGFASPVMEGERMQLTCKTSGSKPAADIRWFKNDKEVKDAKYLKEEDANRKTFTVSSTLDFRVDRNDDGAVVSCRVDHESLNSTPQIAMQVLEIHYTPSVKIISSNSWPEEGQTIILTCESKGKPVPEPVLWTKDGGELPDPERMVVNGRDLSISFLNKTDNGTYRCEATNPIGQNSTEYVLIVHDVSNTLLPITVIPSLTTATVTTTVALTTSTAPSATAISTRDTCMFSLTPQRCLQYSSVSLSRRVTLHLLPISRDTGKEKTKNHSSSSCIETKHWIYNKYAKIYTASQGNFLISS